MRKYLQFTFSPVKYCFIIFLISRIVIFLQLNWLNQIFMLHLPPSDWLMQFDAGFYKSIALIGYDSWWQGSGKPNYAFFPLLPILALGLHYVLFMPIAVAGQLLSNLCFFWALYLFYNITYSLLQNTDHAKFAVVLLAFSPFNIYFASFYTESLFLFLSLVCWYSALNKHWVFVGIAGLLLSATRPTGVLILLPIFIFIWQDFKENKVNILKYWPILFIPAGLLAFMLYLKIHVGSFFAFQHAETYWHRTGWHFHGFLHQLIHNLVNRYNTLFLFISLYFSYKLFKFKRYPEACYMFIMILPAILSGVFDSIARYSGCLFTFYLTIVCLTRNNIKLQYLAVMISFLYLGIYLAGWINGSPMFM